MVLTLRWVFWTYLRLDSDFCFVHHELIGFYNPGGKFTARYGLIPYIKQITFLLLKVNSHVIDFRITPLCSIDLRPSGLLRNNFLPTFRDKISIFNYALQPFKAYCAIWVRRSNSRHQASPRMSPRESTQRRKVELWARNAGEFFSKCRLPRYI
jgi:hypothetical protein